MGYYVPIRLVGPAHLHGDRGIPPRHAQVSPMGLERGARPRPGHDPYDGARRQPSRCRHYRWHGLRCGAQHQEPREADGVHRHRPVPPRRRGFHILFVVHVPRVARGVPNPQTQGRVACGSIAPLPPLQRDVRRFGPVLPSDNFPHALLLRSERGGDPCICHRRNLHRDHSGLLRLLGPSAHWNPQELGHSVCHGLHRYRRLWSPLC
mmetsp:Transcript_24940/g.46149  ORF Transcript_24940/g.46149 Transcript_24940/m.46149 type:complete len:207 (+) Transcript_24940:433-1053(+)